MAEEKKGGIAGFFEEFKKFITRGNVLDMAVGVIVGGAFTAIVNGLSNFVLKPIINWLLALIFGKDSLSGIYTFLRKAYQVAEDGTVTDVIDLSNSIYIDWGAFINAIINFFLIALVLFTIVKIINSIAENNKKINETIKEKTLDRHERKELKQAGVNIRDKKAVKQYFENKKAEEERLAEEEKAKKAEEERQHRLENPTTEDLLKQILLELKKD